MQVYHCKQNAMSSETPTILNKKFKLHSQSDDKHTWSHKDATTLLLSHLPEQKQNWSQCARTLQIPGSNAGQSLKEYVDNKVLILQLWKTEALHLLHVFTEERKDHLVMKFPHHPYKLQKPLQLIEKKDLIM